MYLQRTLVFDYLSGYSVSATWFEVVRLKPNTIPVALIQITNG